VSEVFLRSAEEGELGMAAERCRIAGYGLSHVLISIFLFTLYYTEQ